MIASEPSGSEHIGRSGDKRRLLPEFEKSFRDELSRRMRIYVADREVSLYSRSENIASVILTDFPSQYEQIFVSTARELFLSINISNFLSYSPTKISVKEKMLSGIEFFNTEIVPRFQRFLKEHARDRGLVESTQVMLMHVFQDVFGRALKRTIYLSRESIWAEESIKTAIAATARTAPRFKPVRGRLQYQEKQARKASYDERKAVAQDRCNQFEALCKLRSNEQPELNRLSAEYSRALGALRPNKGAYTVHLAALALQSHIEIAAKAPFDAERNPPLDADILSATHQLVVAHAGLVSLFPDIAALNQELDQYLENTKAIEALKDRILDPILDRLAISDELLDYHTQRITREIQAADAEERSAAKLPSQGITAAKHGWVRGILAAIGNYLLEQVKAAINVARDATIKEKIAQAAKDGGLAAAVLSFLAKIHHELLAASDRLEATFGWLRHLLRAIGIIR
jgi:hypothetical protein